MNRPHSFAYALLVMSLGSGCSEPVTTSNSNVALSPAASPQGQTTIQPDPQLQKQIDEIAATAKGRVGIAAMLLAGPLQPHDSHDVILVSLNLREHFPMQSVYKLPIGMAVMNQVDAGKLTLDQKVRVTRDDFIGRSSHSPIRDQNPNGAELSVSELLGWMLKESDGTASDVLMRLAGGPSAIQAYLTELGITDMKVLDTEKAFAQDHSLQYRNWATPEAALKLLRALQERRGLSEASQSLLLQLMAESSPGVKRLKGMLPGGTVVAHKTGTSGTDKGVTAATNDIGIITLPGGKHLAIAVFVGDSSANGQTREAVIAKTARAVWDSVTSK